jgi:hypothetical protein
MANIESETFCQSDEYIQSAKNHMNLMLFKVHDIEDNANLGAGHLSLVF